MKKLLTLGFAILAVISAVGVSSLGVSALDGNGSGNGAGNGTGTSASHQGSAQGNGYQTSLESRAKVLNMTATELQAALQTKTMSQLAVDKGMTEADFEAKMHTASRARWEARGLSDSEIATRTAAQLNQHDANVDHEFGTGDENHMGGYGHSQ